MFIFNVLPLREFCSAKSQFAKSPNLLAKIWYGLTVYIRFFILNLQFTSKIFQIYVCLLAKIPANQAKFTPFACKSHELREFCTKIHPHLVHYFQTSDHRQSTPGNYSELRRFRVFHPQFPRTMRNSHHSHQVWYDQESKNESSEPKEITVNYADPAPFTPTAGKLREISDICTPKLRTIFITITHLVIAHTP